MFSKLKPITSTTKYRREACENGRIRKGVTFKATTLRRFLLWSLIILTQLSRSRCVCVCSFTLPAKNRRIQRLVKTMFQDLKHIHKIDHWTDRALYKDKLIFLQSRLDHILTVLYESPFHVFCWHGTKIYRYFCGSVHYNKTMQSKLQLAAIRQLNSWNLLVRKICIY